MRLLGGLCRTCLNAVVYFGLICCFVGCFVFNLGVCVWLLCWFDWCVLLWFVVDLTLDVFVNSVDIVLSCCVVLVLISLSLVCGFVNCVMACVGVWVYCCVIFCCFALCGRYCCSGLVCLMFSVIRFVLVLVSVSLICFTLWLIWCGW